MIMHFKSIIFSMCVSLFAIDVKAAEVLPIAEHQTRTIEGWTVHVADSLLENEKEVTERALELLTTQLEEITRVVPDKAVAELRKVPLWFNPEYTGVPPGAEYHPGVEWLRDHGRDPAMVKAVEFTCIRNFEAETKRMPNFALHELAHAFHDQVLQEGFGNRKIKAAFEAAQTAGLYDKVEQRFGDGRSENVRAYAMSNPMEYFAECSEAFFSTNDFFPFTSEQLVKHDPAMFELLNELWGANASTPSASPVKVFILAGQSNMEGHGVIKSDSQRNEGKGSLEFLAKDTATAKKFASLLNEAVHSRSGMGLVKD
jgi:Glucose-regulated metallo-peptidase M90